MFAAVRLDAGRTQIDQLSLSAFQALPQVPQMIRRSLGQLWGELSRETRAGQRDLLAKALANRPGFPLPIKKMLPVTDVAVVCFEGLAQLSYTVVDATICCDGKPDSTGAVFVERRHYYAITSMEDGVQGALSKAFDQCQVSPDDSGMVACSQGENCRRERNAVRVVLDRLPPVFMVTFPDAPSVSTESLYDNVRIKHLTRHGWTTTEYEVIGCILCVNHLRGLLHFNTEWRAERDGEKTGPIVHYDGMKAEQATFAAEWGAAASSPRSVEVMFYRLVSAGKKRCGAYGETAL